MATGHPGGVLGTEGLRLGCRLPGHQAEPRPSGPSTALHRPQQPSMSTVPPGFYEATSTP